MNIGKVGRDGENKVASFLRKNGYAIVKRNFQCRYGEIDIIAENDEYILFVEVKTRKEGAVVSGKTAVNASKQKKLLLAASQYADTHPVGNCRFDVAEVYPGPDGDWSRPQIHYIPDAFQ